MAEPPAAVVESLVLARHDEITNDAFGVVFGIEYWPGGLVRTEKNCCCDIDCLVLRQGSAV